MMDRTTTGVSSARSMSHDDPQILTEPPRSHSRSSDNRK